MQFSLNRAPEMSQMTAANARDVNTRPPDCAGQAADAVSSYTQVKLEDAPRLQKKSKVRTFQTYGYVFHDTSG